MTKTSRNSRLSVRLDDSIKEYLVDLSIATGITQNALIQQAVVDLIQKYKQQGVIK